MLATDLKRIIREVPDFPKPGINFYDLTTLFRNAKAFGTVVDKLVERYRGEKIDAIVGIESRGFVLAGAVAHALELGLILVRKPGKLPAETDSESYDLEYGTGKVEMHRDAVGPDQRVLVVDDLLATGGTAAAAGRLVERAGGCVEGYAFVVELAFLGGRARLGSEANIFSLIQYA
jgi:adenine phosphoribosyltransferase